MGKIIKKEETIDEGKVVDAEETSGEEGSSEGAASVNIEFMPQVLIETNEEVERKNEHIRSMKAISHEDIVIEALRRILYYQKHNALTQNREYIRISYYNLGIENDYHDVSLVNYRFHELIKKGLFSDFEYDGKAYKIFNVDVKEIRNFIDQFERDDKVLLVSDVSGSDVNLIPVENGVELIFKNFGKLPFAGKRAKIFYFFYNSDDRKNWKSYKDIKSGIDEAVESSFIRKSIEKINERFMVHTGSQYGEIIEKRYLSPNSEDQYHYRWKF